jgi:hypothetical protein
VGTGPGGTSRAPGRVELPLKDSSPQRRFLMRCYSASAVRGAVEDGACSLALASGAGSPPTGVSAAGAAITAGVSWATGAGASATGAGVPAAGAGCCSGAGMGSGAMERYTSTVKAVLATEKPSCHCPRGLLALAAAQGPPQHAWC